MKHHVLLFLFSLLITASKQHVEQEFHVDLDLELKLHAHKNLDDFKNRLASGPCNIPVLTYDTLTQDEFLRTYAHSTPVIFRRASPNDAFRHMCQLENLIAQYGHKHVTVSTANTHSYRKYSMPLRDYYAEHVLPLEDLRNLQRLKYGNETWYFFGENNLNEWKPFFDAYERPRFTLPEHSHAYSFGIAGPGTGVPFHFHGPGFAETILGRKRWFLYEPAKRPVFDPNKSTLQWLYEHYDSLASEDKPLECVLEPFDIIWFPNLWWHATLNVDTVVFMSTFLSET